MCGIVYCKDFRGHDVVPRVKARYKAQRMRGTQGFGYYIPAINRLSHNPDEHKLLNDMTSREASEVLFHHRFPTSTPNVQNACHPFSTKWDGFKHNYVMVHNGYLSNDEDLMEAHLERGITYVSEQANGQFNDSEALLYDIALYLEGLQTDLLARGAIAFVVIERGDDGVALKLHYGRNAASPLRIKYKPGRHLTLASEGAGIDVEPNMLHTFTYATGEFTHTPLTIPGYESKVHTFSQYEGYDDGYTWKPQGATSTYSARSPLEYNRWSAGNHWICSTDANIADRLCHLVGETCPQEATKAKTDLGSRAKRYAEDQLLLAQDDVDIALENLELDLTEKQTEYALARETLKSTHEDANEYLGLQNKMDILLDEIKIREDASELIYFWSEVLPDENEPLLIEAGDRE